MKRLITLLLSVAGFAAAEYNVGDRIPVVLDHFGIIFERDTVIDTATILYKGADCYVAACYINRYVNKKTGLIDSTNTVADTAFVDSVAQVVYEDFQTNGGKSKLLSVMGVEPSDLVDVDGDPRVFIILAPVYPGKKGAADNYNSDPGLYPFFGYFDPFNEDTTDTTGLSNKKEMLVLDVSPGGVPASGYPALLAYLYSRYVMWSLDPKEELISITGLAMYNAFKAGYDVKEGFVAGRCYGGLGDNTNRSLYSYTYYYTNSPVAREQDKERSLLWFLWLDEKLGDDFIKELAFNKDYLARYQITEKLSSQLGLNIPDAFTQFALTCALNHYNVSGYTFSSLPGYQIFTGSKAVSSPQWIKENGQVIYVPFKKAGSQAMDIYFKGQEGNKMVISGDTVPGFRVFVFDTTTKDLTDYTDQLDTINRVILPQISGKHNIYVININTSTYYFWIGPGAGEPAPELIGMYSIQNPAFLKVADIYLASKHILYSDASPADTTPKIVLEPADPSYNSAIYKLSTFLTNDTAYHGSVMKRLYTTGVSIELKDQFGNVFSGDVYVKLYRAMNKLGIDVSNPMEDTLGLVHIYGAGTYSLIGGNVILDIPQGSMANGTLLLVDKADAKLALADGSEGTVFQIGASSIPVMRPFTVRLATDGLRGLYYKNGDRWEPIQAYMSPDNTYLVATLSKTGTYLLGRPSAPEVTVPELWAPTAIREGEAKVFLSLPSASSVSWSVYDVSGKRIAQPYEGTLDQGSYVLTWNTSGTPSGIYFYRITVNEETHLRKVAFIGR